MRSPQNHLQSQVCLHKQIFLIIIIRLKIYEMLKKKEHWRVERLIFPCILTKFRYSLKKTFFPFSINPFTNQFISEIGPRGSVVGSCNGEYLSGHSRKLLWTFNLILIKFCVDCVCQAGNKITVSEIFWLLLDWNSIFPYFFKVKLKQY